MTLRIRKAAVIGAGTMGRGIASHLANAGIPSILLDIVPPKLGDDDEKKGWTRETPAFRNKFSSGGLQKALKDSPPSFYDARRAGLIEVGNVDDDIGRLAEVDWIIEVVFERLDVKQKTFTKIAANRRPGVPVTSNTSGLQIVDMLEAPGLDDDFKKNFFVTHFFNPVRYMNLLEVVPAPDTNPSLLADFVEFGGRRLGKGIVVGKDTPNFIANRIGTYGMLAAIRAMVDRELDVTTVDAIVGQPMGRPKSAAFRTADLVGLDVLAHVASNVFDGCPDDPERAIFDPPAFVKTMLEKRMLGSKTGGGFYKKVKDASGKRILQLNWQTFEYEERPKVRFESTGKTRKIDDPGERVKTLIAGDDLAAEFAWDVLSSSLIYSANRIPEVVDDIVSVDRALRWGFNWDLGPFEVWDAIGVAESVERMESDGKTVPEMAKKAAAAGGFYKVDGARTTYFDQSTGERRELTYPAGHETVARYKAANGVIDKNLSATLLDLGDGVACLEFHSKMNSIDDDIMKFMHKAVDTAETDFDGLVIANDSADFSVGANVMLIYMAASQKLWGQIDEMLKLFQQANQRMRYSSIPTVSVPTGRVLGGGAEVAMGADRMRANGDTFMGLVEMGMGLIPGGGGTKELLRRVVGAVPADAAVDPFPFVRKVFETIGMAKVSASADDARNMGFLTDLDGISLSRERLLHDAKADVIAMASAGYRPGLPAKLKLPGVGGAATLRVGLSEWVRTGTITEYEGVIGGKLAHVLCGGDTPAGKAVSEDYLLDIEREAFLSLCGEQKTQDRIQHFLMKGKPLRN